MNEEIRNIDQQVAEDVMGWKLTNYETGELAKTKSDYEHAANNDGWTWSNETDEEAYQFQPSTRGKYAFDVLEFCSNRISVQDTVEIYRDTIQDFWIVSLQERLCETKSKTLPMAICEFSKRLTALP